MTRTFGRRPRAGALIERPCRGGQTFSRIICVIALSLACFSLLPLPLAAQDLGDLGGFLGGDAGGLLNIPAPRGNTPPPANRGAAPARGGPAAAPPVDRLVRIREMLAQANAPLTPQQEAALNALLDAEIPGMRRTLQARILELQKERAAVVPTAGAAPSPPTQTPTAGARGTPPIAVNPDELLPDLNRLNDQLAVKIAASPALTADQQAVIGKAAKQQIRSRGGFDALNLAMQDAGAPFTPEQASEIQALFNEQNRLRAQMIRELQGQPLDPAKISQLEKETLTKVLRLLNPAQKAALNAGAKPPQ